MERTSISDIASTFERYGFTIQTSANDANKFNVYESSTGKFIRGGFSFDGLINYMNKLKSEILPDAMSQISLFGRRYAGSSGTREYSGYGGMRGSGDVFLQSKERDPYAKIPMIKKIMQEEGYL